MYSVEPTPDRFRQLSEQLPADTPIVMINLLRYRERAEYPEGSNAEPCSGREAYQRYGAAVVAHLKAAGGEMIWMGSVQATPIAVDGEEWDDALLVRYPSKQAFLGMVTKPDYQKDAVHRTAALLDSRLIATLPTLPEALLRSS